MASKGASAALSSALLYLSLFKLRTVALLLVVAGLSAFIAQGGFPPGSRLALLLLAGALASGGASVLNHYLDRDIDSLMERTRRRPLPSGNLPRPGRALALGILLIAASLPLSLRLNGWVALYTLMGVLVYVAVYTWWLKRRTWLNIVVGGTAGSFAVLAGWAAVSPQLSPLAFLIALLVFLWTPVHFWNFALVHLGDYQKAGVPMLPVVGGERTRWHLLGTTLALFLSSLLPWAMGYLGMIYLVGALLLGLLLWGNLRLLWDPRAAWTNYKLSGIYLAGILATMALDLVL